jgi:hypothetical protein
MTDAGRILFKEDEKEKVHTDYPIALSLAVHAASEPELAVTDLFQ